MRATTQKVLNFGKSKTATDTLTLFSGNALNAFFSFLFTLIVARALSVSDFGVFSAVGNLVYIIIPLSDLGVSSGIVRFVSELESQGKVKTSLKYINAAFAIKFVTFAIISIIIVLFPDTIARALLASTDANMSYWVVAIGIGLFLPSLVPFILNARRKFFQSAVIDTAHSFGRNLFVGVVLLIGALTLHMALLAYALAGIVSLLGIAVFFGFSFIKAKPNVLHYKKLLSFSSWLGVNKIISTIASRVDVQLLALLAGAASTGVYSIASKLALFISILAASFSAVIAPRLSSFGSKQAERSYIVKTTFAVFIISLGIALWALIAEPFIVLLFGSKYIDAVGVFRVLAIGMIPFLFTVPSVTAIIYALKKPKYIGFFSIFQLATVFALDFSLIPQYGAMGAALTLSVVNFLLMLYSWVIIIKYYWR